MFQHSLANFILGPFATFAIKDENCSVVPFSSLKFSYDGQKILAVNEGKVYVVEAFEGHVLLKANTGTASSPSQSTHPVYRCPSRWYPIGSQLHT